MTHKLVLSTFKDVLQNKEIVSFDLLLEMVNHIELPIFIRYPFTLTSIGKAESLLSKTQYHTLFYQMLRKLIHSSLTSRNRSQIKSLLQQSNNNGLINFDERYELESFVEDYSSSAKSVNAIPLEEQLEELNTTIKCFPDNNDLSESLKHTKSAIQSRSLRRATLEFVKTVVTMLPVIAKHELDETSLLDMSDIKQVTSFTTQLKLHDIESIIACGRVYLEENKNLLAELSIQEASPVITELSSLSGLNPAKFLDVWIEFAISFDQIEKNSQFTIELGDSISDLNQSILLNFYSLLQNIDLITYELVDKMIERVDDTLFLRFPFTLTSIAKKESLFKKHQWESLFYKILKKIAETSPLSHKGLAKFKMVLKSARKNRLLSAERIYELDSIAESQNIFQDQRYQQLQSQVNKLRGDFEKISRQVEANTANIANVAHALTDLKLALQAQAKRKMIIGIAKAALSLIPVIGGCTAQALDATHLLDLSDVVELTSALTELPVEDVEHAMSMGKDYLLENKDMINNSIIDAVAERIGGDPDQFLSSWMFSAIEWKKLNETPSIKSKSELED